MTFCFLCFSLLSSSRCFFMSWNESKWYLSQSLCLHTKSKGLILKQDQKGDVLHPWLIHTAKKILHNHPIRWRRNTGNKSETGPCYWNSTELVIAYFQNRRKFSDICEEKMRKKTILIYVLLNGYDKNLVKHCSAWEVSIGFWHTSSIVSSVTRVPFIVSPELSLAGRDYP